MEYAMISNKEKRGITRMSKGRSYFIEQIKKIIIYCSYLLIIPLFLSGCSNGKSDELRGKDAVNDKTSSSNSTIEFEEKMDFNNSSDESEAESEPDSKLEENTKIESDVGAMQDKTDETEAEIDVEPDVIVEPVIEPDIKKDETVYSADGSFVMYDYDEVTGVLLKETQHLSNGNINVICEYCENGELLFKYVYYYYDDPMIDKEIKVYDAAGNYIKVYIYNAGSLWFSKEYDLNGYEICYTEYDMNGEIYYYIIYNNDANGNMVDMKCYDKYGNEIDGESLL